MAAAARTADTIRIGRRVRRKTLAVGWLRVAETGTWVAIVRRLVADLVVGDRALVRMMPTDRVVQACQGER
jgi:hypothetical protein